MASAPAAGAGAGALMWLLTATNAQGSAAATDEMKVVVLRRLNREINRVSQIELKMTLSFCLQFLFVCK